MKRITLVFVLVTAACQGGPTPGTWSDAIATLDPAPGATFPEPYGSDFVTLTLEVGGDDWPFEPCGVVPKEARDEDPNAFSITDVTCVFPNGVTFLAPEMEFLFVAFDPLGDDGVISVSASGTAKFSASADEAPALLQGQLERQAE